MAHNLPAVLHAQLVDDGDVGRTAGRLALEERGDQVAGPVHDFTAIAPYSDLQAQRGGRLFKRPRSPAWKSRDTVFTE